MSLECMFFLKYKYIFQSHRHPVSTILKVPQAEHNCLEKKPYMYVSGSFY